MEPVGEKLRQGDGIGLLTVPAQALGRNQPVDVSARRQADGRPGGIGDAAPVGHAGQAHQQPPGHVRGLRAHGGDPGAQGPPAQKIVLRALVCPARKGDADADDHQHIRDHDHHDLHGISHHSLQASNHHTQIMNDYTGLQLLNQAAEGTKFHRICLSELFCPGLAELFTVFLRVERTGKSMHAPGPAFPPERPVRCCKVRRFVLHLIQMQPVQGEALP